jgi:hypothetical protein
LLFGFFPAPADEQNADPEALYSPALLHGLQMLAEKAAKVPASQLEQESPPTEGIEPGLQLLQLAEP